MRRTKARPIPAGRLTPVSALTFGSAISFVGAAELFYVNFLTGLLASLSLLLYVLVYTPLKRKTWLSTIVGAIPGALPPVMGWTAAQNAITLQAGWLFAVLFLWQLPHFLAIAWIYREDYASAEFPLLPVIDSEGKQINRKERRERAIGRIWRSDCLWSCCCEWSLFHSHRNQSLSRREAVEQLEKVPEMSREQWPSATRYIDRFCHKILFRNNLRQWLKSPFFKKAAIVATEGLDPLSHG